MSVTKKELLDRIEKTREILKDIFKAHCGHPHQTVREIVSQVIEAQARLDGKPEHDV